MISKVLKRNGDVVDFNRDKIKIAVEKAMAEVDMVDEEVSTKLAKRVSNKLSRNYSENMPTVDSIHILVENTLMDMKLHDIAREYITYRDRNRKDIFRERTTYKPFEYPELNQYVGAIQQSYWIKDEFNYNGDIQDFRVEMTEPERECIRRCMLAISQVEVTVKDFWGKVGDRIKKPEIQEVGAVFAECHVEGTEILTDKGWKDFRNIDESTTILQYDMKTNSISPTLPEQVVSYDYQGDVHIINNGTYFAKMSPNHRILYYNKNGEIKEKFVKDIGNLHSKMMLPFTGELLDGARTRLSSLERLKIAIQADGSERWWTNSKGEKFHRGESSESPTYEISVKKDRKKNLLWKLLEETKLPYREYGCSKEGYIKVEIDFPVSEDTLKSFKWVNLKDKSASWCKDFIQEIAEWDGYRLDGKENAKNCLVKYITSDESCADMVQAVGIAAGYRCNVDIYEGSRKESYKTVYTVSFTTAPRSSSVTTSIDTESYTGKVYCVTVPTGAIITRLNKKVLISGNSEVRHSQAYSHLLEILGLNTDFDYVLSVPAVKKRVAYMRKALKGKLSGDIEDYVESLLMFTLFVENVSLFSQFLIISTFNKEKAILKGMSNAVAATSLEENLHFQFGADLINTIRLENPEWFDSDLTARVYNLVDESFQAELEIIDWIFEYGDFDFLRKYDVVEYIKTRYNKGLIECGFAPAFTDVDSSSKERTQWFDLQATSTTHTDFFSKRVINYSKNTQSFDEDSLFD